MLIVHHLENSRSHRVLWLLEELELPYVLRTYKRDPKTMLAPDKLRNSHPLGKSPLLEDDGLVYAESGAILMHLLERYGEGRFLPATEPARSYARYWTHYAEGSAMPLFVMKLVMQQASVQGPTIVRPLVKAVAQGVNKAYTDRELKKHVLFWEQILSYNPYFAGDELSIADIQMSFALEALAQGGGPPAVNTPKSLALLSKLRARPAYQRALEKGGPLILGKR